MTYEELVEKVAQVICREWGYIWDGDSYDAQTSPEVNLPYDDRPSKKLFREASIAAIDTIREVLNIDTEEMINAAEMYSYQGYPKGYGGLWRAMLAASPLGEKKG